MPGLSSEQIEQNFSDIDPPSGLGDEMQERILRYGDFSMIKNSYNLIFLALIGCLILGCARFTQTPEQIEKDRLIELRSARADIFNKRPDLLDEYSKEPAKELITETPYLKGKIVLLHSGSGKYAPYRNLSEEFDAKFGSIYASDPADVQTVVLIKEDKVNGGTYVDANGKPRASAAGFECKLTIIDREMGAVIFRKTFKPTFKDTAKVDTQHETVYAAETISDVIDFLGKLERR